jgi:dCTP deaminase
MIKSDRWIIEMVQKHQMIQPFSEKQVRKGIISFGVSSYGYDIRIANEFRIIPPEAVNPGRIIDPKAFDSALFAVIIGEFCVLQPNSYLLSRSVEYFKMPQKVLGICMGKSTYARCGIMVNVTPLEPEWEGYVTMAIVNASPIPVRIYANEGIAQILFLESDELAVTSYRDKGGKYQGQTEITPPKVE